MIALLPESISEAQQYLNGKGVHADQVKQISPGSIGVRGTPTMLFVNGAGVITQVWTGKLEPKDQELVIGTLHDEARLGQSPFVDADRNRKSADD